MSTAQHGACAQQGQQRSTALLTCSSVGAQMTLAFLSMHAMRDTSTSGCSTTSCSYRW